MFARSVRRLGGGYSAVTSSTEVRYPRSSAWRGEAVLSRFAVPADLESLLDLQRAR